MIFTASWSARLPASVVRVGISRGVPRWLPAGSYRRLPALNPGPWFRSVEPADYLRLYDAEILAPLDPAEIVRRLEEIGAGQDVALCCWESARDIARGATWCHRHIVGAWLRDRLGLDVPEYDWPDLDPWGALRAAGVAPPTDSSR